MLSTIPMTWMMPTNRSNERRTRINTDRPTDRRTDETTKRQALSWQPTADSRQRTAVCRIRNIPSKRHHLRPFASALGGSERCCTTLTRPPNFRQVVVRTPTRLYNPKWVTFGDLFTFALIDRLSWVSREWNKLASSKERRRARVQSAYVKDQMSL